MPRGNSPCAKGPRRGLVQSGGSPRGVRGAVPHHGAILRTLPAAPFWEFGAVGHLPPLTPTRSGRCHPPLATILIAVADGDLRDLFFLSLTARGHQPRTAADLRATFAAVTAGDVDLLVLDWPPDPHAHQTLVARCRAIPELAGLPVVAVGVAFDDAWVERAVAAGVTSFLSMPFTLRTAAQVVADLTAKPSATDADARTSDAAAAPHALSA